MSSGPPSNMDTKIERADKALKDARTLIQAVAGSASKKQNKAQTRMSVLSGVAEIDQRAKGAVSVFMSVLQLESDRRENDEGIVAVCYSMTSMIYVLRYLNRDVASREDLADQLAEEMGNMSEKIKDFGAFADVYYTKCKSWIVRFARSKEFKTKIHDFADTFQQYQERIEFVLVTQMAGGQLKMSHELAEVKTSISTLIDRVGTATSDREKQVLEYIKSHGEQILQSTQGLTEVARTLHDTVTSSTVEAINDSFEHLVEQNSTLFEFKLKGATMELSEAIDRSTAKILNRLESGPHDLIDEPDIKEIWKRNEWKFSVKCRIFVDALCNYYTEKFLKSAGEEGWTLKILSKVINYPAVGEAIDEDASGFISVHEINHFLKRNKELSTAVWFALYTGKIDELTENLEERCRKLQTDDQDLNMSIDGYLDTLKLVACITEWAKWDAGASGLEELDDETEQDLVDIALALAEKKEALIEANLEAVGYQIDQSSLPSLTDEPAFRIEQSITVLLFLILRKHDEIISAGMENMTAQQFASKWQDMEASLFELVETFHKRFKSLRRNWRSQKLDIKLQVQCYAGGLFNGWYCEYDKEKNIIVKFLESDDDEEEDSDEDGGPGSSSGPPTASVDAKVDQLSQRVTALDARLDTIESMLKQILISGLGGTTRDLENYPSHKNPTRAGVYEYQASAQQYGGYPEDNGQNNKNPGHHQYIDTGNSVEYQASPHQYGGYPEDDGQNNRDPEHDQYIDAGNSDEYQASPHEYGGYPEDDGQNNGNQDHDEYIDAGNSDDYQASPREYGMYPEDDDQNSRDLEGDQNIDAWNSDDGGNGEGYDED
ncbi:hypothetical protein B0H12DRAFT_1239045 [Mycena haematopus]|nr:hypothetical protein B0H12DRAFT_1239045 [Mycena haematopus]